MKKSLISVTAIALLALVYSGGGIAAPTHPNEVGLYTSPNGGGATGTFIMASPVDVYLVLTKPSDPVNGYTPYASILAFELGLTFTPTPNNDLFLMGVAYPPGYVDVGLRKDINEGVIDFIVAASPEWPVVAESVVLVTLTFVNTNPGMTQVTLGPALAQSIPGEMAFIGEYVNQIDPMYSVGGGHDAPVFIFNGEAVAVEKESFGSVKALYR